MKNLIIGAGHAGVDPYTGDYLTAPNKMAYHKGLELHDGGWFYEGVFNRAVLRRTAEYLTGWGVPFLTTLHPTKPWVEVPVKERVRYINQIARSGYPTFYMEIHSNYFQNESVNGIEVYTSKGLTKSDAIADVFYRHTASLTSARMRPGKEDGDYDKEENFYILKRTNCPCILTEWRYFSNRKEAALMVTEEELKTAALAHALTAADWYYGKIQS